MIVFSGESKIDRAALESLQSIVAMADNAHFTHIVARLAAEALHFTPAVLVVVCAVPLAVSALGVLPTAPFAYPLAIAAGWMLVNYFFEVLQHRSFGGKAWPVPSLETISTFARQTGIVFAAVLVIGALAISYLGRFDSGPLPDALALVGASLLPASAAVFAITGRLRSCLSPSRLVAIATRTGPAYFLLLGIAVAFCALALWAFRDRGYVSITIAAYAFLLVAYSIGTVVYQRREAIGLRVPRPPETVAEAERAKVLARRREALARAYHFATRGNLNGAVQHVMEESNAEGDPLDARLWMFWEMSRWDDPRAALEFGRVVRDQLESAGALHEAHKVSLAIERLSSDDDGS